ncbi:hypothetical protein GCM10023091_43020 [Ravibacter arvi]|uniref:Uncharacterized protein n=1 Tax=Ravibacter arvi TaxID=2051041 RepID=A0ABP8MCM0_9BACT
MKVNITSHPIIEVIGHVHSILDDMKGGERKEDSPIIDSIRVKLFEIASWVRVSELEKHNLRVELVDLFLNHLDLPE